jgi:hypothetical protein
VNDLCCGGGADKSGQLAACDYCPDVAWAYRLHLARELPMPLFHDADGNVGHLDEVLS